MLFLRCVLISILLPTKLSTVDSKALTLNSCVSSLSLSFSLLSFASLLSLSVHSDCTQKVRSVTCARDKPQLIALTWSARTPDDCITGQNSISQARKQADEPEDRSQLGQRRFFCPQTDHARNQQILNTNRQRNGDNKQQHKRKTQHNRTSSDCGSCCAASSKFTPALTRSSSSESTCVCVLRERVKTERGERE